VRLGVLTDIHHCPPGSPPGGWHNPHHFDDALDRLRTSLAWLEGQRVDRLAVLGDLTHFGDEASLGEVLAVLGASSLPTWILTGNHDLNPDHTALEAALDAGKHANVRSIERQQDAFGPDWLVVGLGMERGANGAGFTAAKLDMASWGATPAIVVSHFPVLSTATEVKVAGLKYAGDLANAAEIESMLLARTAPTVAISGHLHVRHAMAKGAVLQASCAAQIESLFEATVFDFGDWGDRRISWDSTSMQDVSDGKLPVLSGRGQRWSWDGAGWTSA